MLNNKKTTLRLPTEDYEALLNLSLDTGLTVNALMIVACLKYLDLLWCDYRLENVFQH